MLTRRADRYILRLVVGAGLLQANPMHGLRMKPPKTAQTNELGEGPNAIPVPEWAPFRPDLLSRQRFQDLVDRRFNDEGRRRLLRDVQPFCDSPGGDLGARVESKFVQDALDMALHCALTDEQQLGNLAV